MTQQYPRHALMEAAQRTADVYARLANKMMGSNIPVPVQLYYDLCLHKPKSAGEASHEMAIGINWILYEDNVEHILNETIPHEIGHLVQFSVFDTKGSPTRGHGCEWQEIMRRLGRIPVQCHSLDVTRAVEWQKKKKQELKQAAKEQQKQLKGR